MIITSTALIKSRINNAKIIVNDLMSGKRKPDKIFFFISEEPHNLDKGIKPTEIPRINNNRVEFIYTPNIGSLRKIVPILKMYWGTEGHRIIIFDDDFRITKDAVKNLCDYTQRNRFHACGIAGNLYLKGLGKVKEDRIDYIIPNRPNKRIARSIELGWELKKPKQVDMLSSGLGLMIKPKFFHKDILEWEKYIDKFGVNITDELFVSYMLALKGTPRFTIPINTCPPFIKTPTKLSSTLLAKKFKHQQSVAWDKTLMKWRL